MAPYSMPVQRSARVWRRMWALARRGRARGGGGGEDDPRGVIIGCMMLSVGWDERFGLRAIVEFSVVIWEGDD